MAFTTLLPAYLWGKAWDQLDWKNMNPIPVETTEEDAKQGSCPTESSSSRSSLLSQELLPEFGHPIKLWTQVKNPIRTRDLPETGTVPAPVETGPSSDGTGKPLTAWMGTD